LNAPFFSAATCLIFAVPFSNIHRRFLKKFSSQRCPDGASEGYSFAAEAAT
jgi:hypothetical protein